MDAVITSLPGDTAFSKQFGTEERGVLQMLIYFITYNQSNVTLIDIP